MGKFFKASLRCININIWRKIKIIIPVRCFSCGKPIGHLWEQFKKRVAEGEKAEKVLDELGLERYCCRAVFLGHTDQVEIVAKFKKS